MSPSLEYFRHILDEAIYIIERSKGLGKDEFIRDQTLRRAFVRSKETEK